jgi:trigger factor
MDFKAKKKQLKDTKYQLEIEFSQKVFEEFKKQALKKLAAALELKGFRKGKVPLAVAQKELPQEKIIQEALSMALPEVYARAVQETKLKPIGPPQIKVKKIQDQEPIKLEAEVEVLPKITLPDFKKLKVKKESSKLTDKELREGLQAITKQMASYDEKKGSAAKGDWVEISFEGTVKGAKIDQLTSKNHPFVLGEGGFIKGFEEKIINMKKDQEKTFSIALPKKHPDKLLADQKAEFKVKLNNVKKVNIPTLKEIAPKIGAKNEKDFKAKFEKAQQEQKKKAVEQKYEQQVVAKVIEKTKIKLPEGLVDQEYQRISAQHKAELQQNNMKLEDYLQKYNIDAKELEKNLKQTAEQNIKVALVMGEIANIEKIEPTKKQIKLKTEQMISEGMMKGGEKQQLREQYDSDQGQNFVSNVVRNEQTLKRLKELMK